jgi:hypothetical protein
MSDGSETSQLNEKQSRKPPVIVVGGFLIVATAGSAFFVMPSEQPTATTVSATLVITTDGSLTGKAGAPAETPSKAPADTSADRTEKAIPVEAGPAEATSVAGAQQDPETARLATLIIGDWRQDYYGERTLSIKADGTATMKILPSSFYTFVFGPKIDLTMFWSVKDGHLDYGINGGAPADKVKMAAKTWGDHWIEKIIELDEKKLDLLSVDGSTHSIWERVARDPEAEFRPGNSGEE